MSLVEVQDWALAIAAVDTPCPEWKWCYGPIASKATRQSLRHTCGRCATKRLKARKAMGWPKQK